MKTPDVTVAVVGYRTRDLVLECLASVFRYADDLRVEAVLVDNASGDGTGAAVRERFPTVRVIENRENRGFAAATNQALCQARGRHVLLLNPDARLTGGALQALVALLDAERDVAAAAPRLVYADGALQPSCRRFPTAWGVFCAVAGLDRIWPGCPRFGRYRMTEFGHDVRRDVDQPMGACLLVRREAIAQVGLLDERFFLYFEDVDWCLRLRQAGWRVAFEPAATVVHLANRSSRQIGPRRWRLYVESLLRYFAKHHGLLGAVAAAAAWVAGAALRLALLPATAPRVRLGARVRGRHAAG